MATEKEIIAKSANQISEFRLPRWTELPDLDIYMDQLLSLISRYLQKYPGYEENSMTSSMVNNYVKQGIMPPPERKKYNRIHIAALLAIHIMKTSLPIAQVGELINEALSSGKDPGQIYDSFCDSFERVRKSTAEAVLKVGNEGGSLSRVIMMATLRSSAEQSIALDVLKNKE